MEKYLKRIVGKDIKSILINGHTWNRLVDEGWCEVSGDGEIEIFESLEDRAKKYLKDDDFFRNIPKNSYIISIHFNKETGFPTRVTLGKLKDVDQSHTNDYARWRYLECDFTVRYFRDLLTGKLAGDVLWDSSSPVIELNPRYTHLIEILDLESFQKILDEIADINDLVSYSAKF